MRVTHGILFADTRGKAGGVVASKWRGIPTVRSLVTPANPNTAAQQEQRTALAICVASWKSLLAAIQDAWNTYAAGSPLSGFNSFSSANVADERAGDWETLTPPAPSVPKHASFAAVTGALSGEISCTWANGTALDADKMQICVRQQEDGQLVNQAEVNMSVHMATITGLEPGATYAVYAVTRDVSADVYSTSDYTTATAKA
jgi:hypothetical protein